MTSPVSMALQLIEQDLLYPWSLQALANACHCHSTHLARAFSHAVGVGPMSYLRARRLTWVAARVLQGEDGLELALQLGYQSHQAFSRAFRRQFGMTATQLRQHGKLPSSRCTQAVELGVEPKPYPIPPVQLTYWPRLQLAGLNASFAPERRYAIAGLWVDFKRQSAELAADESLAHSGACFGVVSERSLGGELMYTAAIAVHRPLASIHPNWCQWSLTAGQYMSFTHIESPQQLAPFMRSLWQEWLPQAGQQWLAQQGRQLAERPYFSHISLGGEISVHIPVD